MGDVTKLSDFKKKRDAIKETLTAQTKSASEVGEQVSDTEILTAVDGLLRVLDEQDEVLNSCVHDISLLIQKTGALENILISIGESQRALAIVLDEKGMVTENELRSAWERFVVPELEKAGLSEKPKSSILVPNKPEIFIP